MGDAVDRLLAYQDREDCYHLPFEEAREICAGHVVTFVAAHRAIPQGRTT